MNWESRGMWCESGDKTRNSGWLDCREGGLDVMEIVMRVPGSTTSIAMTREQARTFAAHMMNLSKDRS